MPAPNRRRTRGSLANLLGDVIDDTKEFVDDALDTARTLESDVRRSARRVLDDEPAAGSAEAKRVDARNIEDGELAALKAALEDLTAKVDRLTRLRENDKSQ
jgi:hypothetical protein